MENWSSTQILEYKDALLSGINKIKMNRKWYHSRKVKQRYDDLLKDYRRELDKVRNEIHRRLDSHKSNRA